MVQDSTAAPALEKFAAFASAAEAALTRSGVAEESVSPGGADVSIRFAGPRLRDQMMRAFSHVRTSGDTESALRVTIWDSAGSGLPLPREVGLPSDHRRRGLAQLQTNGPILSLFDLDGGLSMLDFARKRAINWVPDANRLTERQRAAPLQAILSWWLPTQSRTVAHAAALGTPAGAVLLSGGSHAGKSTTALACVDNGFFYLGDDLCALTAAGDVTAHSVYCSVKVFEHNLEKFANFARVVTNPASLDTEKAIGYLTDWMPDSLRRSLPVRAFVILGEKGLARPVIRAIPAIKALAGVAPSTFFNLPGSGKAELAGLARLLNRVPCYEMSLSSDLDANPQALRSLIENGSAAGTGERSEP